MPFWHLQPSWRRRPMQEWDRQTWRNTENIHLGAYSSAFSVHRSFFSLLLLAFCSLSRPLEGLCEDVSERPIPSLYVQSLGEIKTFSVPIKQLIGHWNNRGNRTKVKSRVFHDYHPKLFSWFFFDFLVNFVLFSRLLWALSFTFISSKRNPLILSYLPIYHKDQEE